jgi:hypothetical protein
LLLLGPEDNITTRNIPSDTTPEIINPLRDERAGAALTLFANETEEIGSIIIVANALLNDFCIDQFLVNNSI